ncbi:MAG: hypothetical protein Q4E77_05440, partial [Conchiformibius sp.]|nr:hypothetical protein [Conchiformibius sp.]
SSESLFEENLFFYFLVNGVWYLLGLFTLGFTIPGIDAETNLLMNFIWLLLLCAAVCFPAFWYRLVFGKNAYLFRADQRLQKALQEFDEEYGDEVSQEEMVKWLDNNGYTLLKRRQTLALSFLFMVALFDVFYIEAWMRNLALVWQPEWVNACIDWMKSNLALPPIYGNIKLFYLDFSTGDERIFTQMFGSEAAFINAPFGHAALFYHLIRTLLFIPIVTALCVLLWQPLLYLGGGKRYPPFIRGVKDFIGASLWSIVMGFFLVVPTLAAIWEPTWFALILFDIKIGFKLLHLQSPYLFVLPPVQFFIGWLIFWKRLAVRLFHRLKQK